MCCITETARASQRSSFLAVADYSWVILYYLHDSGIWRLPLRSESCCAGCFHGPLYLLLIHIDSSYVSGWSLWDDLGFISPEYHMKQAGTFAGQFFLAPFLLGNLKSGSVVVCWREWLCRSGCKPREAQPVVQHFTKEAGALLLFLPQKRDQSWLYSLCLSFYSCCSKLCILLTHKYIWLFSSFTGILWAAEIHAEDSNLAGVGISIIICCW